MRRLGADRAAARSVILLRYSPHRIEVISGVADPGLQCGFVAGDGRANNEDYAHRRVFVWRSMIIAPRPVTSDWAATAWSN
jgi:hypothetical protein